MAATATAESGNLLDQLGIDWMTLVFQIVAFLILVFVLAKWVYPVFVGIIDKREAEIKASAQAADEAKAAAQNAEQETARLIREARSEASAIVATAKNEAAAAVEAAEAKAKQRAETIVANAEAEVGKQVEKAKRELHNETVQLVALATEKVFGKTVDAKLDDALIAEALKEAK